MALGNLKSGNWTGIYHNKFCEGVEASFIRANKLFNCVFAYAGLADRCRFCMQGISFVRCKPMYRDCVICAASEIEQLKRSFPVT